MKELTYLSPAETLLILDPTKSTAKELARVTFHDLVLRNILVLELIDASPENPNKTKKHRKIVGIGSQFKNHKAEKHEAIFLRPFFKNKELKVRLRNLIKIAFEGIKSTDEYKLKYVYNKRISIYFSANLLQFLMGTKSINSRGIELQKSVLAHLRSLDIKLKSGKNNVELLKDKLRSLNGNILLLKNIDNSAFNVLKENKIERKQHSNKNNSPRYDYENPNLWEVQSSINSFSIIGASTHFFGETIDSIDSFDSVGTDSTNISGDNGCSACSGCGGCGGCS